MEGSEEHFDESEHVGDLAEEERSTDGEDGFGEEMDETRASEREGCRSSEGSDFEGENEGEGYCGPEGSDFAAEESYEEGDPDAEEGYCQRWTLWGLDIRDLEILGTGSWTLGGRNIGGPRLE